MGRVAHAGPDRLRPGGIGGRGGRRGLRVARLRTEREAAGQRRASPKKRAAAERRPRGLRQYRYAAPELKPHVSFPSKPCHRIIRYFFAALSVLANLVNAK